MYDLYIPLTYSTQLQFPSNDLCDGVIARVYINKYGLVGGQMLYTIDQLIDGRY